MNIASIGTTLMKLTGRPALILAKKSPQIMLGIGLGGVVGTIVLACHATLKAETIVAEHCEKLEKIDNVVLDATIYPEKYTEQDHKKDLTTLYVQTAWNFIKLYGPAIVLGTASFALIIGGHRILSKRNAALAAAYKVVSEGFKAYRQRVVEEYGAEKDYMFKNNLRAVEVTEAAYTDENGVQHEEKTKNVLVSDNPNMPSQYARFYDDGCTRWSKNPEYNLMFLRTQQSYFNNMLQAKGHVFLNEIYDALGIPRTKAGQICGWVRGQGDDFIDFGLFEIDSPRGRDFVNGYENVILLDFNVDGIIYDKI